MISATKTRLLAAGLACLLAGFGPAPEPMALCESNLEGVWEVEEFIYRGDRNMLQPAERRNFTVAFDARKVQVRLSGQPVPEFTFDYREIPGQPAFKLRNATGKGIGIYRLEGNRLTIAVVDDQEPCPTTFPKEPAVLIRLRRIQ